MSYKDTKRFQLWRRNIYDRLDREFERGVPPNGSPDEHFAEFRAAAVEVFRAYAATMATPMDGDEDWADETSPWPKRVAG